LIIRTAPDKTWIVLEQVGQLPTPLAALAIDATTFDIELWHVGTCSHEGKSPILAIFNRRSFGGLASFAERALPRPPRVPFDDTISRALAETRGPAAVSATKCKAPSLLWSIFGLEFGGDLLGGCNWRIAERLRGSEMQHIVGVLVCCWG